MSNQYQNNNYKKFRGVKPEEPKKSGCGCKHDKKVSGFVNTDWFKILGKRNNK